MKSKILLLAVSLFSLVACSSLNDITSNFSSGEVPATIKNAVSSRVNPEKELYVLASSNLARSGSIIAQSRANKEAEVVLKSKVKKEVDSLFSGYIKNMDGFSKSVVSPVTSDLSSYATDLIMKKVTQKGAWEDSSKVYSLLSVPKNEIATISDKVFKNFIEGAVKKLDNSIKK
ncbi:hypothetical protein [Fusobacterium massiliense]|uniref:hypothetical protein n=1 Tax=Fusobacterium massiliense TaxID=1852365 RepID=UPI0028E56A37|nr:hypothetical protein [Fusobacterium massiliense]